MKALTEYRQQQLTQAFYRSNNVCAIAKDLIGKILITCFDNIVTGGRIVETEAYNGIVDKASHAYGGRFTNRTAVMYQEGGRAYIYLCYGIHHLFNVVTGLEGNPHAVLIRGIEPIIGMPIMLERMKKLKPDPSVGRGPGNVAKALGLRVPHTGIDLCGTEIFIADDGYRVKKTAILATPRIGVDYAAEDALLPYRYIVKGHPQVTPHKLNKTG
nr:DNA-3-methyladenine glycosylase [uncultured Sediminibacterium sp.]